MTQYPLARQGTDSLVPRTTDDIPVELHITTGHARNYLLGFARKFGLTVSDLADVSEIKKQYSTDFNAIGKLLSRRCSIEAISRVYEARQNVMDSFFYEKNRPTQTIGLRQIVHLAERFFGGIEDADPELIEDAVIRIHKAVNGWHDYARVNQTVDEALRFAESQDFDDIEDVIELLERKYERRHITDPETAHERRDLEIEQD